MKKKTLFYSIISIAVITITAFTFDKRHKENKQQTNASYTAVNTWELPSALNEVSGIVWIGEGLIACVQDEDGKIFIYDLKKKKISHEIAFAGSGDYEGIAVTGKDAFVMRSDGLLYHIENYREKNKKVRSTQTQFSAENNMESFFYNPKDKKLLTIPKDKDDEENHKNVYQITLTNQKATVEKIMSVAMNAPLLKEIKSKKVDKTLNPSELAMKPNGTDVYIVEGKKPKLVILNGDGDIKKVYQLDKSVFAQPEGITFSSDGRMFISNEAGKNSKANILEVKLND